MIIVVLVVTLSFVSAFARAGNGHWLNDAHLPPPSNYVRIDIDAIAVPVSASLVSHRAGVMHFVSGARPSTNALLRLCVDDPATVYVNGQGIAPRKNANKAQPVGHPITHLVVVVGIPDGGRTVVVTADRSYPDNESVRLTKKVFVRAGEIHQLEFNSNDFDEQRSIKRVRNGLLVLYTFEKADRRNMIWDVSKVDDDPLDLLIRNPESVIWVPDGLKVFSPAVIQSGRTAEKIRRHVKASNEITTEAWITPATIRSLRPTGPMCVVSLSRSIRDASFTLVQQNNYYDVRLRSTEGVNSDRPGSTISLPGMATLDPTHVVFTRDRSGNSTIFLNGRPFSRGHVGGKLSWPAEFALLLANDMSGNQPWLGTYHLVAAYGCALTSRQVMQNYRVGR